MCVLKFLCYVMLVFIFSETMVYVILFILPYDFGFNGLEIIYVDCIEEET